LYHRAEDGRGIACQAVRHYHADCWASACPTRSGFIPTPPFMNVESGSTVIGRSMKRDADWHPHHQAESQNGVSATARSAVFTW